MKRYPHIISELFYRPLLITRARHSAICQVVESHMTRVDSGDADEPSDKPEYTTVEETAIIPVHGVIVPHERDIPMSSCGCGLDIVAQMIDVAVADTNIRRLIFDFDTPGGSSSMVPEIGRKIASITSKQTIGFADSECCSAGVWLATQCQQFYCTPSAKIGSIGVWTACLDLSRQMENEGEKIQAISAGKYKLMGAYWKPLTKEETGMLQKQVDSLHEDFKAAVNSRRQIADECMEGQIFDGEEAAEIGLVDGCLDDISELVGS